jgi:hypothetical protein
MASRAAQVEHLRISLGGLCSVPPGTSGVAYYGWNWDGRLAVQTFHTSKLLAFSFFHGHLGPLSGAHGFVGSGSGESKSYIKRCRPVQS